MAGGQLVAEAEQSQRSRLRAVLRGHEPRGSARGRGRRIHRSPFGYDRVELAFAYRHNRPVLAVQVGGGRSDSEIQAMLGAHTGARVLECADFDGCVDALRLALADPLFNATIHEAAREAHEHV